MNYNSNNCNVYFDVVGGIVVVSYNIIVVKVLIHFTSLLTNVHWIVQRKQQRDVEPAYQMTTQNIRIETYLATSNPISFSV